MDDYRTTIEKPVMTDTNGHVASRLSFPDLLTRFAQETRSLLLLEVKLAKSKIGEKITLVERAVTTLSTGGAVLYAGILALVFAAVAGLWTVLDLWLSALIVGAVACVIGGIMIAIGKSRLKKEKMELTQTKLSLQEGKQWMKSQIPQTQK